MKEYFGNIFRTMSTIFEGMSITLGHLFRKPVTIQYPDKIPQPLPEMLPENYRGLLEVDIDICTGCKLCEKSCPIDCIYVDVSRNAETKTRHIERFDIDHALCMVCGICSEACPTQAIRHSNEFEGTNVHIANLVYNYVQIQEGEEAPQVFKQNKDEPIQYKPLGSIIKKVRPAWNQRPKAIGAEVRGESLWKK